MLSSDRNVFSMKSPQLFILAFQINTWALETYGQVITVNQGNTGWESFVDHGVLPGNHW